MLKKKTLRTDLFFFSPAFLLSRFSEDLRAKNTFGVDSEDPKETMMKYDQQALGEDHKWVILKSLLFETNPES